MENDPIRFYSNGKLLITGEYLVMYGAKSLAVPVHFGQSMLINPVEDPVLRWNSYNDGELWFSAEINLPDLSVFKSESQKEASFLMKVLGEVRKLNPSFLKYRNGYEVKTLLNYPQKWGLGSSSTFISNLAQWAKVDAMLLNKAISEGSGYDIACATAKSPILFQIRDQQSYWNEISFYPSFSNSLYFVYLNEKQDTSESIRNFKSYFKYNNRDIAFINDLTENLVVADSLDKFMDILNTHETFMSRLLGVSTVKEKYFPGFDGVVKSLGAWGGDFAMIASPLEFDTVKDYFLSKGFGPLYKFGEWY